MFTYNTFDGNEGTIYRQIYFKWGFELEESKIRTEADQSNELMSHFGGG